MRPPDIQHSGKPHKSFIPESAMFLMANEDRGLEEDGDPTDGGQEEDTQVVSPELASSMQEMIATYGADAVKMACAEATDADVDDNPATDGILEESGEY